MRGKTIALSIPRRFVGDLLHFAKQIPTVPVQRRMHLENVRNERAALVTRVGWTTLFTKAYAIVAQEFPVLRRAYVKLPRPKLYEYPTSVAGIAVERHYQGESAVFIGRVKDPAALGLTELDRTIRSYQDRPIEQIKEFQRELWLSGLPLYLRRGLWWLGLNIGRQRGNYFGTFAVSVYSRLGAESLHPLTPLTTTLNYGVIAEDGSLDVRIIYDHRVLDGATVARALARLELVLQKEILDELRSLPRHEVPMPSPQEIRSVPKNRDSRLGLPK